MKFFTALAVVFCLLSAIASAAVITGSVAINSESNGNTITALWETMGDADTGTVIAFNEFLDRSVQVTGTFNGVTVTIQGSNDGVNFATLKDYEGNGLTFTAAGLRPIAEGVRYLRPITSGGSSTDVDVTLFAKK